MKLIAGSYERFLFGFDFKRPNRDSEDASDWPKEVAALPLTFNYAAHLGPIKSLAASGNVAVSGGNDDIIKIYDLKGRADMGSLMQHEGGVTCLKFHGPRGHPTHLLSGGEDSRICVWDTDTWQHLITLKGHKGAVNDLTIHPTGRLALSVARDSTLHMWSLVQGRASFKSSIPRDGELVAFAPVAGDQYALVLQGGLVGIHSSETGVQLQSLEHSGRVLAMAYHSDTTLLTAGEESIIRAWDTRSAEPILAIHSAHTNRIRGLAVVPGSDASPLPSLLASGASDGIIRVWDPRMVTSGRDGGPNGANGVPRPVMEADSKARLTCLAVGGLWKDAGEGPAKAVAVSGVPEAKRPTKKRKERGDGGEGGTKGTRADGQQHGGVAQRPAGARAEAPVKETEKKRKKKRRKTGEVGAADTPIAQPEGVSKKGGGAERGSGRQASGEGSGGPKPGGKSGVQGVSLTGEGDGGSSKKEEKRRKMLEKRNLDQQGPKASKPSLTEKLSSKFLSSAQSQSSSQGVKHKRKRP